MTANWQPIPLVAAGLGIPEQTIRTWIRRGQVGTCSLPDGTLLVDTSAVLSRRYPFSAAQPGPTHGRPEDGFRREPSRCWATEVLSLAWS